MTTEPDKLEELAIQARDEIRALRSRNAILEAKDQVLTIFAGALFGQAATISQGQSPDVAWAIDQELEKRRGNKETSSGNGTQGGRMSGQSSGR